MPATAQQMIIEKNGSNNEIVNLDNLKQITFSGTTVNVELTNGAKSSTSMSAINAISFGDYTSIGQVRPADGELVAYISSDEIAVNCRIGYRIINRRNNSTYRTNLYHRYRIH